MTTIEEKWIVISANDVEDETPFLYWNTTKGWVRYEDMTLFTKEQRNYFALPMGGEWATIEVGPR